MESPFNRHMTDKTLNEILLMDAENYKAWNTSTLYEVSELVKVLYTISVSQKENCVAQKNECMAEMQKRMSENKDSASLVFGKASLSFTGKRSADVAIFSLIILAVCGVIAFAIWAYLSR